MSISGKLNLYPRRAHKAGKVDLVFIPVGYMIYIL